MSVFTVIKTIRNNFPTTTPTPPPTPPLSKFSQSGKSNTAF